MLLALALSLSASARELKNDGCRCDGSKENVTFQTGFVDGECWASTYVPTSSDYPFTPEWVTFFVGPSGEGYFDIFLYTIDGDNAPQTLLVGDAALVQGTQENLNQVYWADFKVDVPEITQGNVAVVACFDGHSSTPTIANDDDGLDHPDRNWVFADMDGTGSMEWHSSSELGVRGDWIMRLGWGETDADADADADSDSDSDADTDAGEVELYSIAPNSTPQGTAVDVTIFGQGFQQGAQAHIGGLALTGPQVRDDGTLTGRSPTSLPAGTHDVDVVNPDGSSAYLAAAFTVDGGGCGCGLGHGDFGVGGLLAGVVVVLARRRRA